MLSQESGARAEKKALQYLQSHGLHLVLQNYRCRYGEIDLILRDNDTLVFTEIRYRQTVDYGGPITSVTFGKQKKIIRTALFYLQTHRLLDKIPCRFDVVGLTPSAKGDEIEWIKDAFQA